MREPIFLNLGCGTNRLGGWENHDADMDVAKTLPYPDNHVDAIFIEHCLEHTTQHQVFRFLQEAHRILLPNGLLRVTVPSIVNAWNNADEDYSKWVGQRGWSDGTKEGAIKALIFQHGHQSLWDAELLKVCFMAAGFRNVEEAKLHNSKHCVFQGVEGHQRVIGEKFNSIESISVEGMK